MADTYCDIAPAHEWHGPYHDREYGFPLEDDAALFERLMLEINQAGLSWLTILKKREAFRRAYDGFDPAVVAAYGARDRKRLLGDAGIIRNRLKVDAAIANAQRILELQKSHGSFAGWLAAHHPRSKEEWVKLFKKTFRFTGGAAAALVVSGCGDRPMSPARVSGPAGTLIVDDGGRGGAPVVFTHSLAGNSGQWKAQLEHLRPNRRAVAFDFRGHGRSEPATNGDYSIAGMASDISSVVDFLGLERFVLVGHSMGGGAALVYAGAHPERVAGLLLLDPIGDAKQISPADVKSFLGGFESDYDHASQKYWTEIAGPDSAVRRRLLADLRATPRETVVPVLRSVMQFDPDSALARYTGPILSVVTPHNDAAFSLHRLGKGFAHRVVTGTGHWIQLDKPDEFNRLLDEFLKTVSGER